MNETVLRRMQLHIKKIAETEYAPVIHTHEIADIANLQTELDGKDGAVLWSGSWNGTGTITVPDIAKYIILRIVLNIGGSILAVNGANIRGVGGHSATTSQLLSTVDIAVSGTTLSDANILQYSHTVSSNHSSGTSRSIVQIEGLI